MNKNDNRFTEALASALHKMVERERSGAVDCYGWNYQPKRPEALTRDPNETKKYPRLYG
jgi:cyclic lactone autoinducer peptide